MTLRDDIQTVYNTIISRINSNFSALKQGLDALTEVVGTNKNNSVTSVTGSNAVLTVTKGNNTTSTVTINNVANAESAQKDGSGNVITTTYASKTELAAIPRFSPLKVNELPVTGDSTKLYLVQKATRGKEKDYCNEYIWTGTDYELIGDTVIDLSAYYTSAQVDQLLYDILTGASITVLGE